LLAGAYRSCLTLGDALGARTIAFPAISMGIYGIRRPIGARVAVRSVATQPPRRDADRDRALRPVQEEDLRLFEAALPGREPGQPGRLRIEAAAMLK